MGDVWNVGRFTREDKCDYLTNDGTQVNAYGHPESSSSFCCLCPRGTKFSGHCSVTDPLSTKCDECADDEYVDYEPHIQRKCTRKSWRSCTWPKEYSKGTNKESHRCVCPNGTVEDGDDCVEAIIPDLQTIEKKVSAKSVFASTKGVRIASRMSLLTKTTTRTISKSSTILDKISQRQSSTAADRTIGHKMTNSKWMKSVSGRVDQSSDIKGLLIGITTGMIALVAVVLILYLIIRSKRKRTKTTKSPRCSTNTSADSSPSQPNSTGSIPYSMQTRSVSSVNRSFATDSRGLISEGERLVCNLETSQTTDGVSHTLETSSAQNYSSRAIMPPATTSYSQHSAPSMQPKQEQAQRRRLDSTGHTSPSYIADTEVPYVPDDIREKAERIPDEQHELFANDLIEPLKNTCVRPDIRPIFRRLLKGQKQNSLEDIFRESNKPTSQCFRECMELAIRVKGKTLSPVLLYQEIANQGCEQYTDIVSGQIDRHLREYVSEIA